eukprot:g2355.t1
MAAELAIKQRIDRALLQWQDATSLSPEPVAAPASTQTPAAEHVGTGSGAIAAAVGAAASIDADPAPDHHICRPWSRADFNARVASYSSLTWFAKPSSIGPLACARHGWINVGVDLLRCDSCARVLCFRIDDRLTADARSRVVARFASQLDDHHVEECAWRGNPSPLSFASLPASPDVLRADFVARVARLMQMSVALPRVRLPPWRGTAGCVNAATAAGAGNASGSALATLVHEVAAENHVAHAESDAGSITCDRVAGDEVQQRQRQQQQQQQRERAVSLALCGWDAATTKSSTGGWQLLYCSYCQRKLGTWNWMSNGNKTSKCVAVARAKRARVDVCESSDAAAGEVASEIELDLVSEHRTFCPWAAKPHGGGAGVDRGVNDQEGGASQISGWELCARALVARRATPTGNGGAESQGSDIDGKVMESKSPQDTYKTVRKMLSSFNQLN